MFCSDTSSVITSTVKIKILNYMLLALPYPSEIVCWMGECVELAEETVKLPGQMHKNNQQEGFFSCRHLSVIARQREPTM